jgi:FKBP-type peptidyl-prolyl cis-trans isomerase
MHGARRLYGLAAAQGHANAQCTLGFMHAEGKGGPQNLPEARRLSGLAAAQGHKRAMSEAERLANAMAEALLAEEEVEAEAQEQAEAHETEAANALVTAREQKEAKAEVEEQAHMQAEQEAQAAAEAQAGAAAAAAAAENARKPPDHLVCPISQDVMIDHPHVRPQLHRSRVVRLHTRGSGQG